MKAAILEQYNQFNIRKKVKPVINPSEVLVHVQYASICGSDQHLFKGDFHPRTKLPFTPGHEFAGTVEQVGSEVQGFEIGDHVAAKIIITRLVKNSG